jgi:hypothetical protein
MTKGRADAGWRATDLVAWTEHDGPGRPPRGPGTVLTTVIGAGLVCVFSAILFTDTLCPEHRVWVQVLASAALVGTVVTGVGLLRGWATAPALSVVVTTCGMAIGLLDAVHAAERGLIIAIAFGALWLGSLVLVYRAIRLLLWDREMQRSRSGAAADDVSAAVPLAARSSGAAEPADASVPADLRRAVPTAAAASVPDDG